MKRLFLFASVLLIALIITSPAIAQEQEGDESSLLPEIDPQDIEIRSQFKARFPGLSRQPILGFDPNPRVYQIDADRTPFMETREQVVADLPVSELSRPEPPAYTPLHYSSDINAFSRFGIGSYMSPEAKFWGVSRINSKSYIGGDFDYSSSDGHLADQESSFRFFDANAEYATKLSSDVRLGIQGGLENSFNHMPDIGAGSSIPDDARKEYSGFNLAADFEHHNNSITGWKAQASIRYFDATLENAGSILTGESQERVYNGSVSRRWAGANVNEIITIKAGAKGGNYENNTAGNSDWMTARGGVAYERLFNYSTKVTADASVYYVTDQFADNVYFGPTVKVEHPFLDMLTVTVKGGAEPYVKTVEQLHSDNRFLNVDNILRHSYRMHGSVEASFEYDDVGALNLGVQYENISDYPIFRRETSGITGTPAFYEAIYRDAYKIRAYASVTHQVVPERFWLNGKIYLQSPQVQNGGRIPYEEKVGVNSSLHVRPTDKLTIEGWADYVGSRSTLQANSELGGFLLVGSKVDFQITDRFGAYLKLVNLLNQEYEVWQGYTERPFQAYGGVTVKL